MKTSKPKTKGFTLIEVVVVMAIIAVLAVLVVGAINVARKTARETTHRSDMRSIQAGMEAYYARNKSYPTICEDACSTTNAKGFNDTKITGTGAGDLGVKITGDSACTNAGGGVWSDGSSYKIGAALTDSGCTIGWSDGLNVGIVVFP